MSLCFTSRVTTIAVVLVAYHCAFADVLDTRKAGVWSNLTTTRARVEFLENPARKTENQIDRVLDVIGVKSAEVVADVGSGTGLYTFPLANKVGKNGKVYAVDTLDDMLAFIERKMKKDGVKNVTLVKSSASDPRLPPASCDTIIMANTYPHIHNKQPFLKKLRESLKNGGSMAVISVDRSHKVKGTYSASERNVIIEMKKAGFGLNQRYDFLENHYFLIFKPDV